FEMADRPDRGARWMNQHLPRWSGQTGLATHGAWHLALFELALGRDDVALGLYDRRVRAGRSLEVADLIDATALLWRLRLRGTDGGARWAELADVWAPFIDDGFCNFSDIHAMLAFVGAGDWPRAERLEQALWRSQRRPTRHGRSTQLLGLAACRALMAFGRGDLARAVTGLASLPAQAHRLGGSHAQRDVLHLTLVAAIEALRRPRRIGGLLQRLAAMPATHETRQPAPRHATAMTAA
ncbi:MAG TPA: tetratricopeptide repeat protein, partial [Burkholderiaceae bacterium]|nr:tetratricopeptide repeat protein [Burkholderiaceae bacterium]